ncbi:MAG: hypothetical protein HZC41_24120 [Chloroflexi bacterium]|nr:hypothetical protein [Chloroflexota bacterium]
MSRVSVQRQPTVGDSAGLPAALCLSRARYWIGGISLLFVLFTIVVTYLPESSFAWNILKFFNLAWESNAASWWSSMNLLLVSLLAYELFSVQVAGLRWSWLIVALVYLILSWDEMGSLHERAGHWRDLLPYALALVIPLGYALVMLLRQPATRRTGMLLLVGSLLLSSAAGQEYFERAIHWPNSLLGFRVGLEEGTELLGMFIALTALAQHSPEGSVLASPQRMVALPVIAALGLVFHLVIVSVPILDLGRRGDPAAWYPSALLIVPALVALHRSTRAVEQRWLWWLLAAAFALTSLGMAFIIPADLARDNHLPVVVYAVNLLPLALLVAIYFTMKQPPTASEWLLIAIMVGAFAAVVLLDTAVSRRFLPGAVAFGYILLLELHRRRVAAAPVTPAAS